MNRKQVKHGIGELTIPEYIVSEPLKKEIADFKRTVKCDNSDYLTGYICALSAVEGMIAEQPAADVVPVVRCKDCKYRVNHHYEEMGEEPYIKYSCKFTNYSMSDNRFCSFGARMDGDNHAKEN